MKEEKEHREYVIGALSELKSDTEHIKEGLKKNEEHLLAINGRVRKNEKEVSFIKGVGSIVSAIIGVLFGFLINKI
tara:strand:- start:1086 stop:1313 length:228 start_codon:yes stop_codon:yes gene_type:complete